MGIDEIRALTFDVFGTVVDWRASVIEEGQALGRRHGFETDWESFADEWRRDGYTEGMRRVREGELPWMNVDQLHRIKLDEMLRNRQIDVLNEEAINEFNRVWHRLKPWPDVADGLDRLRTKFVVASLSNGNMSLLTNMAKNGGFAWDCVLSSEITGAFKPDPKCYLGAADLLGFAPGQVMMVAAHNGDLRGSQAVGFKTALVRRPEEFGPGRSPDLEPDPSFNLAADDFLDLAQRLGC